MTRTSFAILRLMRLFLVEWLLSRRLTVGCVHSAERPFPATRPTRRWLVSYYLLQRYSVALLGEFQGESGSVEEKSGFR